VDLVEQWADAPADLVSDLLGVVNPVGLVHAPDRHHDVLVAFSIPVAGTDVGDGVLLPIQREAGVEARDFHGYDDAQLVENSDALVTLDVGIMRFFPDDSGHFGQLSVLELSRNLRDQRVVLRPQNLQVIVTFGFARGAFAPRIDPS